MADSPRERERERERAPDQRPGSAGTRNPWGTAHSFPEWQRPYLQLVAGTGCQLPVLCALAMPPQLPKKAWPLVQLDARPSVTDRTIIYGLAAWPETEMKGRKGRGLAPLTNPGHL